MFFKGFRVMFLYQDLIFFSLLLLPAFWHYLCISCVPFPFKITKFTCQEMSITTIIVYRMIYIMTDMRHLSMQRVQVHKEKQIP